jgi:hypothetical protein
MGFLDYQPGGGSFLEPVVAHSVSESSWRLILASRLGSLNHVVLANLSAGKARAGRIVSKRRDKPYRSLRCKDWGKVKNPNNPAMLRLIEEEEHHSG